MPIPMTSKSSRGPNPVFAAVARDAEANAASTITAHRRMRQNPNFVVMVFA